LSPFPVHLTPSFSNLLVVLQKRTDRFVTWQHIPLACFCLSQFFLSFDLEYSLFRDHASFSLLEITFFPGVPFYSLFGGLNYTLFSPLTWHLVATLFCTVSSIYFWLMIAWFFVAQSSIVSSFPINFLPVVTHVMHRHAFDSVMSTRFWRFPRAASNRTVSILLVLQ